MKLDVASSFNPSSPSDQNIFRSNLIKLIHLNWLISLIAVYTIYKSWLTEFRKMRRSDIQSLCELADWAFVQLGWTLILWMRSCKIYRA